jgi:excisionase family DNA binding protein
VVVKIITTMSNDVLLSPIRLSDLESLIQNSVERALKAYNHNIRETEETSECFLNIHEASAVLNLSVPTIYSKVSKRELPVMKRGKKLYFSNKELAAYLKAGHKQTSSEINLEAHKYLIKK